MVELHQAEECQTEEYMVEPHQVEVSQLGQVAQEEHWGMAIHPEAKGPEWSQAGTHKGILSHQI